MTKPLLALLLSVCLAHAVATTAPTEPATPVAPSGKPAGPSGEPDAPAPTIDPTKTVIVPEVPKPASAPPLERKKKKKI